MVLTTLEAVAGAFPYEFSPFGAPNALGGRLIHLAKHYWVTKKTVLLCSSEHGDYYSMGRRSRRLVTCMACLVAAR